MYSVSELFRSYTKQFSRTIEVKADINGTVYLGSDVVDFSIEDSIVPGESFTLGTAISSILNLSIRTTETIAAGAKIIPYIRLLGTSGESEWLKLGEYYVDSRTMNNKVWSFTCYDKLIYGQQDYLSSLNYPASMQTVWNDLCSRLGVLSDTSVAINPTYIFDVAPTGHTLREVMGFIAGAHAASVRMTKDGSVGFVAFAAAATAVETITASDYVTSPQTNPAKSFTRIVVQRSEDGDSSQIEVGTGTEDKTLTLVNPYITQTMLNNMYTIFNGFRYIPFNMDWRCFPYLEVGDRIDAEMLNSLSWIEAAMPWQEADFPWRDLPKFSTVILTNKIFYKGGLKAVSTADSTSAQQSETVYKGSLTEKVKEIDKKALKEYKPYYGVTFGRDYGFKVMSDSGSEAIFNSDVIAMRAGGEDKLYFDTVSGKYKFNGTLEAVDGIFSGTIFAENINTTNAKIATAQIENLEVGGNVTMGANAVISWVQVTGTPNIIDENTVTQISNNAISTATINANQINGGTINGVTINVNTDVNVGNNVYLGDLNSPLDKSLYFNNVSNITGNDTEISINAFNLDLTGVGYIFFPESTYSGFASSDHTHSEYASSGHGHGNTYAKDYTGQGISFTATDSGLNVRINGVTKGNIAWG